MLQYLNGDHLYGCFSCLEKFQCEVIYPHYVVRKNDKLS